MLTENAQKWREQLDTATWALSVQRSTPSGQAMETGVAQGQWHYVGPNKCHWNWDHCKVSIKKCSTEYLGWSCRILGHRMVTHSGWVTHNSHQFVPINYLISNLLPSVQFTWPASVTPSSKPFDLPKNFTQTVTNYLVLTELSSSFEELSLNTFPWRWSPPSVKTLHSNHSRHMRLEYAWILGSHYLSTTICWEMQFLQYMWTPCCLVKYGLHLHSMADVFHSGLHSFSSIIYLFPFNKSKIHAASVNHWYWVEFSNIAKKKKTL